MPLPYPNVESPPFELPEAAASWRSEPPTGEEGVAPTVASPPLQVPAAAASTGMAAPTGLEGVAQPVSSPPLQFPAATDSELVEYPPVQTPASSEPANYVEGPTADAQRRLFFGIVNCGNGQDS